MLGAEHEPSAQHSEPASLPHTAQVLLWQRVFGAVQMLPASDVEQQLCPGPPQVTVVPMHAPFMQAPPAVSRQALPEATHRPPTQHPLLLQRLPVQQMSPARPQTCPSTVLASVPASTGGAPPLPMASTGAPPELVPVLPPLAPPPVPVVPTPPLPAPPPPEPPLPSTPPVSPPSVPPVAVEPPPPPSGKIFFELQAARKQRKPIATGARPEIFAIAIDWLIPLIGILVIGDTLRFVRGRPRG